ncbi:MAG: hypothetical protein R2754_18495 [Microthrixaceae bacterium]
MFSLIEDVYLHLTPTGAYRAVTGRGDDELDRLVRTLLSRADTPRLTIAQVAELTGEADHQRATGLIYRAQEAALVEGLDRPARAPTEPFSELIDRTLSGLSDQGQVVLAPDLGPPLASAGFPTDGAARLAAMSRELDELTSRYDRLFDEVGQRGGASMALVDRLGVCNLGWWPLRFADRRFHLVVGGLPRFGQPEFAELMWALARGLDRGATDGRPLQRGTGPRRQLPSVG